MRPCSGRWSLKPSRLWTFQVCSALAATATSVPSRPAAPRMTTASLSSPCRAPREASRAGPVSVCVRVVWHTNKCKSLVSASVLKGRVVFFYVEATWWETQWDSQCEKEFYDSLCLLTSTKASLRSHTHRLHPGSLHSCVQCVHPFLIFNLSYSLFR